MAVNISETIRRYINVLKVARKPTVKEVKEILRIVGIGFLVIGTMGFIFYMVSVFVGV